MKKILLGTILLVLAIVIPTSAMARVSVGIALPPLVVFDAPPEVIAIPDTNTVYAVPDIDVEMFFWNGWWWRPWEGRWYRSRYYDRGWAYYHSVPRFYYDIDPGWRGYCREHNWHGHPWNYERIHYERLRHNWRHWDNTRYWKSQKAWGVHGYQPRPQHDMRKIRHERQVRYHQKPEVRQHLRQQRQHPKQPHVRKSQRTQQKQHSQGRGHKHRE